MPSSWIGSRMADGSSPPLLMSPWPETSSCGEEHDFTQGQNVQQATDVGTHQHHTGVADSRFRAEDTPKPLISALNPSLDVPSRLIKYYFSFVCTIFSTFDSNQNPFRFFVGQKWQNSRPIFYAMLSMSAAKLSRSHPDMKIIGLRHQSLAFEALREEMSRSSGFSSDILLTIPMLGLSTAWHDKKDLGIITAFAGCPECHPKPAA